MMSSPFLVRRNPFDAFKILGAGAAAALLLSGCDENGQFSLPTPEATTASAAEGTSNATRLVERDVEAPEVFSVTDEGLWDGRPSLGGVWVAHPDVSDPERVIVRNEDNDKFVIGALFRKERDLPGPTLQISSDAAAALGILAGAPANLNVTALRREETEEPIAEEETFVIDETTDGVAAPAEVSETSLDPIAAAGAAIEAAPATPPAEEAVTAAIPEPAVETTADASATATAVATTDAVAEALAPPAPEPAPLGNLFALTKPFIQVGTFTLEENATAAAQQLGNAGILATIKMDEASTVPSWRVLVGPATSRAERRTLMKTIKAEGFSDAFIVAN